MFRTIIKIVRNAVAAAFRAMKKAAKVDVAGVGALAHMFFGREVSLPEPYMPEQIDAETIEVEHMQHELQQAESKFASNPNAVAYQYVCTPRDKRGAIDISSMTPDAQRWVARLTDAECVLVRRSGCENMLKHISGKKQIAGVSAVRKVRGDRGLHSASSGRPDCR